MKKTTLAIGGILLISLITSASYYFQQFTTDTWSQKANVVAPQATTVSTFPCSTHTATNCDQSAPTETILDHDPISIGKSLANNHCSGEGVTQPLSHLPMNPSDFSLIIPYGLMVGGHVTPIDHQYFTPRDYHSAINSYPVYAMADSTIVSIQERSNTTLPATEYNIRFSVSCTFLYYYDLVTGLAPEIKELYEASKVGHTTVVIPVRAGQLIGYIGGRTLDFAVYDTTKPLSGFVIPEHYHERWKRYVADPLHYYTEEVKQLALSRYVRSTEPISGKIDYDIDGRLIGNWFLKGTNGYGDGSRGEDYFKGHLAFAPNHLDPSRSMVSIGSLYKKVSDDAHMQHVISNNDVSPELVSIESGLVKYDLTNWSYILDNGSRWDNNSIASSIKVSTKNSAHFGCVLVQMMDQRTIKFELFVGKKASTVNGFTDQALIYER